MKLATSTERTKFPLQTYEKQQVTGGFGCSQNTTLDKLAQPGHHHRHRSQVSPLQKKARHVYFSKRLARNLSELDSPLHDQYRNTVTSCCTYGEQVGNKIKFKYCNARWCTTCNRVRTAKLINGYLPVINQMSDAYFVTLTDGTQTTSTPVLSMTQTWNAGAVAFEGFKINITDTASAAASLLLDLEVGGTTRFGVRKDGAVTSGSWAASTIAATVGGTGQTSYAVGDLLYADTTTSLAKLADVATGNALISGGVGVAPSWGKIGLTTHISGTLAVGNGGTGITTPPSNGQIPIGNGTTYTAATITAGTGISVTNGSGSITLAVTTGASGVVLASNFVVRETPTGTVNGTNATFTLAFTPLSGTEHVFVNGVLQNPGTGNDYTISGATITFLTGAIPQTNDVVRVSYLK